MSSVMKDAARKFEEIAGELERAAHHARVTASHYEEKNIPRAGAHTTALMGHLSKAKSILEKQTQVAASFALNPFDNPEEFSE